MAEKLKECSFCSYIAIHQFISKDGTVVAYCPNCHLLIQKKGENNVSRDH